MDEPALLKTLTSVEGAAAPVADAEWVFCDRLTTVPGDTCLYNGATVVVGADNWSTAGAALDFSTTTEHITRHTLRFTHTPF